MTVTGSGAATLPAEKFTGGRVRRGGALRRLLRQPSGVAGLAVITVLLLMAVAAPLLTWWSGTPPTAFDPAAIDATLGGLPRGSFGGVGADHWFGVEPLSGRDIFARVVWGARVSLLISVAATALSVLIGTAVGLIAGYLGGWVDAFLGRTMDLILSFPALIFMIALMSSAPDANRELLLVVVLGLFGWPYVGRIVRGQAMALARSEFVQAARAAGARPRALLFREMLPNLAGPVLVVATVSIPGYIATEAGLSFLGVGVRPPTPSWGQMIATAVPWYLSDPVYLLIPCAFLFLTVLAFTLVGDAIRDVVAPGGRAS
ncbi:MULTISPECIES: ABC transporter permease [unclassified Nocardia]|uniref:ABC transporter permease n=1 Tax=unclassified Nocardia TaxID=2637762 RepID=UPI001CE3ED1C|nr:MULTISPECIES: ABC transporter permease [unclassified Nocardia]